MSKPTPSFRKRLKRALRYGLIRIAVGVLSRLPVGLASGLGAWLGAWAFALAARERDKALDSIARAFPLKSDLERAALARECFRHLGHCLLGIDSLARGMGKLGVGAAAIDADLDAAWEVLAEPVQTVMRRHGIADAYEQLKDMTRGKAITKEALHTFIRGLAIPPAERERLLALTPRTYTGMAEQLARDVPVAEAVVAMAVANKKLGAGA